MNQCNINSTSFSHLITSGSIRTREWHGKCYRGNGAVTVAISAGEKNQKMLR